MPDTNVMHKDGQIRAILFREGDHWIGQCIEYDICTQAKTLTELHKKLELTVQLEREESIKRNGAPFRGIPPAPAHFEDMWNRQSGSFTPADKERASIYVCDPNAKNLVWAGVS